MKTLLQIIALDLVNARPGGGSNSGGVDVISGCELTDEYACEHLE